MVINEKNIFDVMISLLCKACVRSVVMSPSGSLLIAVAPDRKQFVKRNFFLRLRIGAGRGICTFDAPGF